MRRGRDPHAALDAAAQRRACLRLDPGLARRRLLARLRALAFAALFLAARGARARMSAAELVALIVVGRWCSPISCRAAAPGALLDDRAGWIEIALFLAVLTALTPRAGRLHGARVPRRAVFLDRVSARSSAALPAARRRPGARAGLEGLRPLGAGLQRAVLASLLYADPAHAGLAPVEPARASTRAPGTSRSTRPSSFVTNTNWQYYGGETTMSYFSQMAGLAVQNFVSAGVGIAVLVALIRGARRALGQELGDFYVDLIRTLLYVLLPLSVVVGAVPGLPGRRPDAPATSTSRRSPGGDADRARAGRLAGGDQACSAPTAAASSTSTPRCRSRTRPGSRTSSRCCSILLIPAALTATYGRMVGNRRQGWAVYARDDRRCSSSRSRSSTSPSPDPTPAMQAAGDRPATTSRARSSASASARRRCWRPSRPPPPAARSTRAMESLSGIGGAVPMAQMRPAR